MKVVIDIWAGEYHQDLVARYIRDVDDLDQIIRNEISKNNLVNARLEINYEIYFEFDHRLLN